MAEQVQSRLAPIRCTDPLHFPPHTYQEEDPEQHGKAGWFWQRRWESLALLSGGQPTQNWHGLALAVPRSAHQRSPTPAVEASCWQKGTTSQHRQPLSFHNWAHLNSLYSSQSRAIGPRVQAGKQNREEKQVILKPISQQGGSKSVHLSQSTAKELVEIFLSLCNGNPPTRP